MDVRGKSKKNYVLTMKHETWDLDSRSDLDLSLDLVELDLKLDLGLESDLE